MCNVSCVWVSPTERNQAGFFLLDSFLFLRAESRPSLLLKITLCSAQFGPDKISSESESPRAVKSGLETKRGLELLSRGGPSRRVQMFECCSRHRATHLLHLLCTDLVGTVSSKRGAVPPADCRCERNRVPLQRVYTHWSSAWLAPWI